MVYHSSLHHETRINCGICMNLCPVRGLDMACPAGTGEPGSAKDLHSPLPGEWTLHPWMLLLPLQVAAAWASRSLCRNVPPLRSPLRAAHKKSPLPDETL